MGTVRGALFRCLHESLPGLLSSTASLFFVGSTRRPGPHRGGSAIEERRIVADIEAPAARLYPPFAPWG